MPCSSSNQPMQRTPSRCAARTKEELKVKKLQRCALSGAVNDLVLVRPMQTTLFVNRGPNRGQSLLSTLLSKLEIKLALPILSRAAIHWRLIGVCIAVAEQSLLSQDLALAGLPNRSPANAPLSAVHSAGSPPVLRNSTRSASS
jgi:hypothetical protein